MKMDYTLTFDEIVALVEDAEFRGFVKGLAAARKDMDAAEFSGYCEGFKFGTEIGETMAHQSYVDAMQSIVDAVETE
jgi:hypothetical protein